MNRLLFTIFASIFALSVFAQGWPSGYDGVMLQGFYWDSYSDTRWKALEKQSDELARYFNLIWVPQSGNCDGQSMGYNPKYYFDQNSSFGTEQELRSMISSFKAKGLGTIADVVINHRQNATNWCDFVAESYKGVTYQMYSTDICSNDDGGACKKWADANGYSLSKNQDSGSDFGGMRDLDHASPNVQKTVLAYEDFLLNDLGYTGFRYDVGLGFAPKYFGYYNSVSKPAYSVGEVWESNETIKKWIDGTKVDGSVQSAAFDFQYRYLLRDAINQNDWRRLNSNYSLISSADYRQYAVTFAENHDTERRSSNEPQDPILRDTLAVNAVILVMPGTPCVFFKHWKDNKSSIKTMIEARRLAGITNTSVYSTAASEKTYYAAQVTGTKGKLIVVVGTSPQSYSAPAGFVELCSGHHWRYLVEEKLYTSVWKSIVERIAEESAAESQSDKDFVPHNINIYMRTENNWSKINYYTWDSNQNTQLDGDWPGTAVSETVEVAGYTWQHKAYYIPRSDYFINFVFSTSNGSPQSVDMTNVAEDHYFVVTKTQSGGKYVVKDVTETVGLPTVNASLSSDGSKYDISGRRLNHSIDSQRGCYIINGKKVIR